MTNIPNFIQSKDFTLVFLEKQDGWFYKVPILYGACSYPDVSDIITEKNILSKCYYTAVQQLFSKLRYLNRLDNFTDFGWNEPSAEGHLTHFGIFNIMQDGETVYAPRSYMLKHIPTIHDIASRVWPLYYKGVYACEIAMGTSMIRGSKVWEIIGFEGW